MWICRNCGGENQDNYLFCVGCGQPRGEDRANRRAETPPARTGRPLWPWVLVGGLLLTVAVLLLVIVLRGADDSAAEEAPWAPAPAPAASEQPVEPEETPDSQPIVIVPTEEPAPAPTPGPSPTPLPGPVLLSDAGQLDGQSLRQLCDVMDSVIATNVRTTWGAVEHLNRASYVGCYLLTARDPNAQTQNMLILVYRNEVSIVIPAESVDKDLDYYYSLEFENVLLNPDGSLSLGEPQKPTDRVNASVPRHNFYYNGHKTTEEVYRAWVKPYESGYTVSRIGELP